MLVGVVLGIVGLVNTKHKKTFAVAGTLINGLGLLLIGTLLIIGAIMNATQP